MEFEYLSRWKRLQKWAPSMTNGKSQQHFLLQKVTLFIVVPNVLLISVTFVLSFYLDKDVFHLISYFTNDKPPLPRAEFTARWGDHYFGDYAMNYWIGRSNTFSIDQMYGTPWLPAAYLFLQPFTFFQYQIGFYAFVCLAIVGVFGVTFKALSNFSTLEKFAIFVFAVLLSAPVLSSFDRGNTVILLLPLVYLYLVSTTKPANFSTYILLALIVGVKPHLFPLVFLIQFNWKKPTVLIKAFLYVALFQGIGFLLTDESPLQRISSVIGSASRISSESVFANSRSAASMIAGLGYFLPEDWEIEKFAFQSRNFVSLVVLIVVLLVLALRGKTVPMRMRALLLCGSIPFALPISPVYNNVILLSVLLFAFWESKSEVSTSEGRYWDVVLVLVVAFHVYPVPIEYGQGISYSALLSPLSFVCLISLMIFHHERDPRISPRIKNQISLAVSGICLVAMFMSLNQSEKVILDSPEVSSPISYIRNNDLCGEIREKHTKIGIEFYVLQNNNDSYQDFFQTDNLNGGIRLERDPGGTVSLVVAEMDGTYSGIAVNTEATERALHGTATISANGKYSLTVNGKTAAGQGVVLTPTCNQIMVGQGYNSERQWNGKSKVKVVLYKDSNTYKILIFGLLLSLSSAAVWRAQEKGTRT